MLRLRLIIIMLDIIMYNIYRYTIIDYKLANMLLAVRDQLLCTTLALQLSIIIFLYSLSSKEPS